MEDNMPDFIPEDDYGPVHSCELNCEDGLYDCISRGKDSEGCELTYHNCTDECDRLVEAEEL